MQEEISFGVWLRKQRHALDLTRQAFADQVGCAEVTLRRIEGGTLKPSKELASILLEKLGIPEIDRPKWVSFARGVSGFPSTNIQLPNKPKSNLPAPLTSFVGREKEQADVMRLITKHRLVTLTGSGGVGKTRLSIKVGEQISSTYPDGVWLVELASILDPQLVSRTTAIAIGLRDEPQRPVIDMLSDYLRKKKLLLILDNCEHLLDTCAWLADTLLKRCPNLKILATSREILGILGEATYRVPSLALPDRQQVIEKIRDYASVRLFEDRAQLARMDFFLTLENASSVVEICSRLDGIPLAIELAAARISTFSTEQITVGLRVSFSLLTMGNRTALPRHQTLQAAIDWSYDLLSPDEQTLFHRLSVFVDGWTLEAAESICSDAHLNYEAISDLLTQLINKSLVVVEEKQIGTRYRMLETLRQYANEKLVEAGEGDALHDRYLEYFLNLAETAEPYLIQPEQIEWLPVLDADYENLRLALERALLNESAELPLRLCAALGRFWVIRCYWLEGLNWVKRALAKPSEREDINEKIARARALYTHADLEWQLANFEGILAPAQASFALASEVSDKKDIAIARFYVGVALRTVDKSQALSSMKQSFSEFEALNEIFWQAHSHPFLGDFLVEERELKLRDKFVKNLELARKAGERSVLAHVLSFYAYWLVGNNRLDDAWERAKESDKLYKQIGAESASINSFMFARIAWLDGNFQEARSLYMELIERLALLGEKAFRSDGTAELGLLAIEQGNLHQAQTYLEQALTLAHEAGREHKIALRLTELSNLFYLQGNRKEFRQNARDGLSFKNYFLEDHKALILATILGSLYIQKPENSTRVLGAIDGYSESEYGYLIDPIYKRYCDRAEVYARKTLGDKVFDSLFAEGQKMSLDEARNWALKTVEEI